MNIKTVSQSLVAIPLLFVGGLSAYAGDNITSGKVKSYGAIGVPEWINILNPPTAGTLPVCCCPEPDYCY